MNNRFDEIIRQRNREQLEKTREYYSKPENQNKLRPEYWQTFSEALADTEHDLIVYAPSYYVLLPEYTKAIESPIFHGMDIDDLFYFFDPDYILDNIDQLPQLHEDKLDYDPAELVKPFLIPLYAKYILFTGKGMKSAVDYNMYSFDYKLREEINRPKKYQGSTLFDLAEEVDLIDGDIKKTRIYKAIDAVYHLLNPTSYELALRKGALMHVGTHEVSITDKDFQYALTTLKNNVAYILPLASPLDENIQIANGYIYIDKEEVEKQVKGNIQDLDMPLFKRFFSAVYKSYIDIDNYTTTVYFPTFCREAGLNPYKPDPADEDNKSKRTDLLRKMEPFKNCIGVLNGEQFYKVYDIIGFDQESQTLTFATPYMNQVILSIAQSKNRDLLDRKGKKIGEIPGYVELIHADIATERNKSAVEILEILIVVLVNRGLIPDRKLPLKKRTAKDDSVITCNIKIKTIIDRAPTLKDKLSNCRGTSNRNDILRRAFKSAYQLIDTHTDLKKVYKDFSITEVIPTSTTLNSQVVISHYGKTTK